MADKDLSLNIVTKSDSGKAFKDIADQLKGLQDIVAKLKDSFKDLTFGKEKSANHPDSFVSHVEKARGAMAALHKETKDFHKEIVNAPRMSGPSGSGNWSNKYWTLNGDNGPGGPGGGGPGGGGSFASAAPGGKPSFNFMSEVLPKIFGGMQTVGTAAQGVAGAMGTYAQFDNNQHLMGYRNLIRSQAGFNTLMQNSRNMPPGLQEALLNNVERFKSGSLTGDSTKEGDKLQTNRTTLDETTKDTTGIKAGVYAEGVSTAGSLLQAIGSFGAQVMGAIGLGGAGAAISGPALAGGASNVAGAIGDTALAAQKIQANEVEARTGLRQAEQLRMMSETSKGIATSNDYATGHATAQLRLHGSRLMGGEGQALGMFGQGGALGYDPGQTLGAFAQFRGEFGTRAAREITPEAMRFSNAGFDMGAVGGIMGRMEESGSNGAALLEKIMAAGIKNGMKELDTVFFQKIGEAVSTNTIGAMGKTGMASGALFSQGLTGGQEDGRMLQENVRGLGFMNQMQASNPFLSSRNLAGAANILGPSASIESMETLSKASFEDLSAMASGEADPNNMLSIFGITPNQAQQAIDERSRMLGSIVSIGESAPAKRIRAALANTSGDLFKASKGNPELIRDASAMGVSRLGGADLMTMQGGFRATSGLGSVDEFMQGKHRLKDITSSTGRADINAETKKMVVEITEFVKEGKKNIEAQYEKWKYMREEAKNVGYDAPERTATASGVGNGQLLAGVDVKKFAHDVLWHLQKLSGQKLFETQREEAVKARGPE